jgi:hypothetical protein
MMRSIQQFGSPSTEEQPMHREPFDALTRRVAATPSRRAALAALLGTGLAGVLEAGTFAKKGKKRKKACPRCPTCPTSSECPCPGGRLKLTNGTCAVTCTGEPDCPTVCICQTVPSTEGQRLCAATLNDCPDVPLTCETTAQCPLGQFCSNLNVCGKRCVPVCG